ncbi:alkaline phosphatase family protein [bacterium AH-315-C07]|nr:alkaline phosphatase family protein [bacterium AH-315-C07]
MIRTIFLALVLLAACNNEASVRHDLVSGPMIGHVNDTSARIWIEVDSNINSAAINFWREGENPEKSTFKGELNNTYNPIQFDLQNLKNNSTYYFTINLGDNIHFKDSPLTFHTLKEPDLEHLDSLSFLVGSCAYFNDPLYDWPGRPYGQDPGIFSIMNATASDFMVWLGDNVYLREHDVESAEWIGYRYNHVRKQKSIQEFLASRPHYAIWDDHDFGLNDADSTFHLRESSLEWFKKYWSNRSYGEPDNPGIYFTLTFQDVQLFLLDNRYYRSPNDLPDSLDGIPNSKKHHFGKKQLQWLEKELTNSTATFKLIISGNQFLKKRSDFEFLRQFPYEYQRIINMIRENKVEGVLFVSGDKHYTELIKVEHQDLYPLYDFTSSPLTSTPFHTVSKFRDYIDEERVEGTMLIEQNFGKILVSGTKGRRRLLIETIDKDGTTRWSYQLHEKDLKFKEY